MNQIILIGRLTKEPELKYTQSGKAVCNFTLAVNRPFAKDGDQKADFISIQVWGKQAESAADYLAKGSQCAVSGRLQIRSYEGNDGVKKYVTEVVADRVEFLGGSQKKEGLGVEVDASEGAAVFGDDIPFGDNGLF